MADVLGGFQPDTKAPSSRRADFDLRRRIAELEAQVAAANADIAALEAIPAWTSLTLGTGWTQRATWEPVAVRKIRDVVSLRGTVNWAGGGANPIVTLPVGMRPPAYVGRTTQLVPASGSHITLHIEIYPSGAVNMVGLTAVTGFHDVACDFSVTP